MSVSRTVGRLFQAPAALLQDPSCPFGHRLALCKTSLDPKYGRNQLSVKQAIV